MVATKGAAGCGVAAPMSTTTTANRTIGIAAACFNRSSLTSVRLRSRTRAACLAQKAASRRPWPTARHVERRFGSCLHLDLELERRFERRDEWILLVRELRLGLELRARVVEVRAVFLSRCRHVTCRRVLADLARCEARPRLDRPARTPVDDVREVRDE